MIAIVEAAGWPIWFLIFASIIAIGLIAERLWYLRSSHITPPNLLNQVVNELGQHHAGEAAQQLAIRADICGGFKKHEKHPAGD